MNGDIRDISLYFHIPFCTKKCDYCHFYVLPDKAPYHEQLMEGLILDLDHWAAELRNKRLVSIYFGGGTPSLLGAAPLSQLLKKIQSIIPFEHEQLEITLEANPETITKDLMQSYADVGVNRVSIGIQSLDNQLLIKLGRTHHAATAIKAVETTAKTGISNISIDLMYDIPGQSLVAWQQTLAAIKGLPITHLSLYNLTIEPNTVFFKYREALQKELPDADCSTQMYLEAVQQLNENGLIQYEISAFARDNKYSRHNVGYWTGRPFLGFGPSAFSYWEGKRFRAVANLNQYVKALKEKKSPVDFTEELPLIKHQRELLAIGLRLCAGVDLEAFEAVHGKLDQETVATLQRLRCEGLLKKNDTTFALTERGMLFYDTVASDVI